MHFVAFCGGPSIWVGGPIAADGRNQSRQQRQGTCHRDTSMSSTLSSALFARPAEAGFGGIFPNIYSASSSRDVPFNIIRTGSTQRNGVIRASDHLRSTVFDPAVSIRCSFVPLHLLPFRLFLSINLFCRRPSQSQPRSKRTVNSPRAIPRR